MQKTNRKQRKTMEYSTSSQYSKEFPTIITSDQVKTIISNCEKADPGTIESKARPIMYDKAADPSNSVPGQAVKAAGDTGTYELGKSKN